MNAIAKEESTSSLAQHIPMAEQSILFEDTRTLPKCQHLATRTAKEAIEIEKRPECMKNYTVRLSDAWKLADRRGHQRPARAAQTPLPKQRIKEEGARKSRMKISSTQQDIKKPSASSNRKTLEIDEPRRTPTNQCNRPGSTDRQPPEEVKKFSSKHRETTPYYNTDQH
ncbi:hypothetical protein Trydic_g4287 [Trypoxylus dichotomus]